MEQTPTPTNEIRNENPKFVDEERVYNYRMQRFGTVKGTPRAGTERVRVQLDGNAFPIYYWRADYHPDYEKRHMLPGANVDTKKMETDPDWAAKQGSPIKQPEHVGNKGDHMKSYLINYVTKDGQFHVVKIAAKGIVTAITMFYFEHADHERAIVSVICVL